MISYSLRSPPLPPPQISDSYSAVGPAAVVVVCLVTHELRARTHEPLAPIEGSEGVLEAIIESHKAMTPSWKQAPAWLGAWQSNPQSHADPLFPPFHPLMPF